MADMNIQARYNEICALSGLSEDVVRRVLKASRQSLAQSLKRGERATLPGICTMIPEIKNRLAVGGTSMTSYIKVKAKASNALASELDKANNMQNSDTEEDNNGIGKLNFVGTENGIEVPRPSSIRTTQISSLL